MQASFHVSLLDGGPKVVFRAPGIESEAVVEYFKASLAEIGLVDQFRFRIKFGNIQVKSAAGRAWRMLGDENSFSILEYSDGIDWTKHIWFMRAENPFNQNSSLGETLR